MYRKEVALDEGEDPLDWWRARRPQFPKGKASPSQWASCSTKKGLPFRREHAQLPMQLFLKDNIEL